MMKKDANKLIGNERFEGFCIDLLDRISKELSFTYEVNLVKDGLYGNVDENGRWDGMIGEILRKVWSLVFVVV